MLLNLTALRNLTLSLAVLTLSGGWAVAPTEAAALPAVGGGAATPVVSAAPYDCEAVVGIPPSECVALVDLYNSTNGPGWSIRTGWLDTTTPCEWFGITCIPGHVHVVNLIGNQLAGPIPSTVSNLTFLQFLFLDHNSLTGPIPLALTQLVHLISLELDNNQLSGPLPPELSTLPLLLNLDLDDNFFTGSLPAAWGSFANLRTLDLDNNLLTGQLPATLGNLSKLTLLDVHGNQLNGNIPAALGNATNLITLDLSSNQFNGGVPPELGNLAKLATLNLSGNQFTGAFPTALQSVPSLTSLGFQNTGLCEPISAPFQAWLSAITVVLSTEIPCPVAGRNLRITTGATDLTWQAGEGHTGYVLLRYNTATAVGDLLTLPPSALTYAESEPDGALYCYLLVAMDGTTVLGASDLLCALAGQETGTLIPGGFAIALNQTSVTTLQWSTPPGGVDAYSLVVIPLSGAVPIQIGLGPAITTTTQDTGGVPTCYMLIAVRGVAAGSTNVLCAMPGFSSLNTGGRVSALEALQTSLSTALGMLHVAGKGYSDLRTAVWAVTAE